MRLPTAVRARLVVGTQTVASTPGGTVQRSSISLPSMRQAEPASEPRTFVVLDALDNPPPGYGRISSRSSAGRSPATYACIHSATEPRAGWFIELSAGVWSPCSIVDPSHRSQMVVAPWSMEYCHDG